MCRSIKTLRRADRVATKEEVRAAALQFVRKISGRREPLVADPIPFERAVDEVARAADLLLRDMAPPRPRKASAASARPRRERPPR